MYERRAGNVGFSNATAHAGNTRTAKDDVEHRAGGLRAKSLLADFWQNRDGEFDITALPVNERELSNHPLGVRTAKSRNNARPVSIRSNVRLKLSVGALARRFVANVRHILPVGVHATSRLHVG